jgi:hypothetical protein
MKILGQVQIEDRQVELIEFLGYEIPDRFNVLMWFSLEDFDDPEGKSFFLDPPFGVKFYYEIGIEGTPNVVEVRIQGAQNERANESDPLANDFGIYEGVEMRGRVFRHNLGFVEKNFTDILILGLQFVIQKEYKKRDLASGKKIDYITKRVDRGSLLAFEKEIREEVGKSRKLTPEFLKRVLEERARYKKSKGSHYGFNEYLADKEGVGVKAVEKWIAKAELSLRSTRPKGAIKTKKVSATKAGSKKSEKVVKNGK